MSGQISANASVVLRISKSCITTVCFLLQLETTQITRNCVALLHVHGHALIAKLGKPPIAAETRTLKLVVG